MSHTATPAGDKMDFEQELHDLAERMHKCELWAAGHDGKINEKWRQQEQWNREHDEEDRELHGRWDREMAGFHKRLQSVEKKVMYISGIMAAIGATAGTLLSRLIG